jgi:hypothetical protein
VKVATEELTGAALDWAAAWSAIKVGAPWATVGELDAIEADPASRTFSPTGDWGAAGPLLDGLQIDVAWFERRQTDGRMLAFCRASARIEMTFQNYRSAMASFSNEAQDQRVAMLRCYVATTGGLQVDVPASIVEYERQTRLPKPVAHTQPADADPDTDDDVSDDEARPRLRAD